MKINGGKMETILTVAVIVFIALMIFIGQHRGMIKMIFSLASMLIVLILVQILTPITKDFIETTPVYDAISKQVTQYVDEKIVDVSDSISQTGETAQKNTINSLPLPKSVKESLIKNNNADGYIELGVENFSQYVAEYLIDSVLNASTFILLFVVLTLLVQLVVHLLDIISKLPGINMLNKGGGAVIGLIEAVFVLWIACIIITAFSATSWGQQACEAIENSVFLSLIYDNNAIQMFLNNLNLLA